MAKTIALGSTGLKVSGGIGLGCMGITAFYGPSMADEDATALLKGAFEMGYTHFDTAEGYRQGSKTNEEQMAPFLASLPRESFTVATKFNPFSTFRGEATDCKLDTVQGALDASLKRLGLEYVDLYYCHRPPPTLEMALDWIRSAKALVEAGKIKHVGLSEFGEDWIRQMHAIHPIAAVQQEWSVLTRNLETTVVPVYKELGIGVVAYSPLARNLLARPERPPPEDWRSANAPRYQGENFEKNLELVARIEALATGKGVSAATLSLAWVLHKAKELGVACLPIPGTTKLANAATNLEATKVELTAEEMVAISELGALVAGDRGNDQYQSVSLEGQLAMERPKL